MNRRFKQGACTVVLLVAPALLSADQGAMVADTKDHNEERGSDVLDLGIVLYDSEGHFGLLWNLGIPIAGRYLEYQLAGTEVVHLDGSSGVRLSTGRSAGTPYAFHTYTPQHGSIRGFGRVGVSGWFTVPVPASSLGLTNGPSKVPYGGTPPGGHGTVMSCYDNTFLADSKLVPSTAIPVMLIPDGSSRTPMFTAEYLVGNTSHDTVGIETMSFPTGWFQVDGAWFVVWGYEESPAPFIVYVPEHLPLGGIRGTLELTGYASDSVEWVAEDLYGVRWIPLLSSIPGSVDSPSPSQILDLNTLGILEGAFILEPAIREKLLGQSELFTNLKAASDLNHDGVLDAADFVPLQAGDGRQ
jgi:hypothetical protein